MVSLKTSTPVKGKVAPATADGVACVSRSPSANVRSSSASRASKLSSVKPSRQDVKEVVLDVIIAIATFVVLQLIGIPFWARLLICFLSDYLRFVYSNFNAQTLLGSARSKLCCVTKKASKVSGAKRPKKIGRASCRERV